MNLFRFLSTTALYNVPGEGAPAADMTPQADTAAPAGETTIETPSEEPSLDDQLSAIWDEETGVSPRDERGRFASRKQDTLQAGDGGKDDLQDDGLNGQSENKDDQPDEQGVVDGPEGATDDMPNSWSKDSAEVWKSLTPEAKAIVLKRETETQQALSRAGRAVNIVKNAQPVLDAVAPFTQYLNQVGQHLGKEPAQLINDVLRFENTLRTAPNNDVKLEVLKDIVAEYGIDVSSLIGADANAGLHNRPEFDISKHPEFVEMRRQLHQLKSMTIGERQQQMREQAEEMENAYQEFSANKQDFPHFDKVRHVMAGLIQAMPEDPTMPTKHLLKKVYDAACRADPDIFASIQKDQQTRTREQQQQQQRERAARASRAAATNVNSAVPTPTKQSFDQDLEAIANRHYK